MKTFCFLIIVFTFSFVITLAGFIVQKSYTSEYSNANIIANFINKNKTNNKALSASVGTPIVLTANAEPTPVFQFSDPQPATTPPVHKANLADQDLYTPPPSSTAAEKMDDVNQVLESAEATLIAIETSVATTTTQFSKTPN